MMHLDDNIAARLTDAFGMRIPEETGERLAVGRKMVVIAHDSQLAPATLVRLLRDRGLPCAWSYMSDGSCGHYTAYYVGLEEGDHGHA